MITGSGFQFLLMNRRSQVWFFIINLLETLQVKVVKSLTKNFTFSFQQRGEDISEHLIFLFQLSFATFGKVKRNEIQRIFHRFDALGLFVRTFQRNERKFSSTSSRTRSHLAKNGSFRCFLKKNDVFR